MYVIVKVGSEIAEAGVKLGLKWLKSRRKNVSKHVGYHTVKAINAARRNARYLSRALGRSTHSIFRDPRPRKLVERVLKNPDQILKQPNGRWIIEKQFNRAVGKAGEMVVKVVMNPTTGRIITAYPVIAFTLPRAAGAAEMPEEVYGDVFDERVIETIEGIDVIITQWLREKEARDEKERWDILSMLVFIVFSPAPAGDPNEVLYMRIHNYVYEQGEKMIREVEEAIDAPIPPNIRQKMHEQFRNAVSGIGLSYEEDD